MKLNMIVVALLLLAIGLWAGRMIKYYNDPDMLPEKKKSTYWIGGFCILWNVILLIYLMTKILC